MSYEISKNITIRHTEDDWEFSFSSDEYGTVTVYLNEGLESMHGETTAIHIPKDCIQHFIDALRSFQ
jgi:hypothetical protein